MMPGGRGMSRSWCWPRSGTPGVSTATSWPGWRTAPGQGSAGALGEEETLTTSNIKSLGNAIC